MSVFNKILDKLGLRKDKDEQAGQSASTSRKPSGTAPDLKTTTSGRSAGTTTAAERGAGSPGRNVAGTRQEENVAVRGTSEAMSRVDVMNMLEQKARGTGLNWKQSISDLLFLLDIDNSYEARVELARELGAPQEVMGDSARMNTWLHKTVLRKIAENGGNIPPELLD